MPGVSEQMQSLSEEIIKSHTDRKSAIKYIRGEVKRIQKTTVEFRASFRKELGEANKNWTNMYNIIKNKKRKFSL